MMALQSGMTVYLANRHSLSEFMGWVKKYKIQTCSMTPQASNNMPVSDDDAETDLRHIIGYYYRGDEHFEAEKRVGVPVRELCGMTEIGIGTLVPLEATDMVGRDSCGITGLVESSRFEMMRVNLSRWVSQGRFGSEARGCFWVLQTHQSESRELCRGLVSVRDLARQDERGYVWIIGRLKEMIKRSGENIASIEVESTLRLHPDVIEAGVLGVPDPKRKEEVKAYIVLAPGKTQDDVTPEILTAHCRELLADFKVPRYWAYVSDFPRTATNKIAKQRMIDAAEDFAPTLMIALRNLALSTGSAKSKLQSLLLLSRLSGKTVNKDRRTFDSECHRVKLKTLSRRMATFAKRAHTGERVGVRCNKRNIRSTAS